MIANAVIIFFFNLVGAIVEAVYALFPSAFTTFDTFSEQLAGSAGQIADYIHSWIVLIPHGELVIAFITFTIYGEISLLIFRTVFWTYNKARGGGGA